MTRADEMLYKSKENGRDCYSITTNISEATVITLATSKNSSKNDKLA